VRSGIKAVSRTEALELMIDSKAKVSDWKTWQLSVNVKAGFRHGFTKGGEMLPRN